MNINYPEYHFISLKKINLKNDIYKAIRLISLMNAPTGYYY